MRSHKPRLAILALALTLSATLMSCSQSPTAPVLYEGPVTSNSSARWTDDEPVAPETVTQPSRVTTLSVSETRTINGLVGGTVRAGDFRVVFPPGAIRGSAQVTVSQADPTRREVELEISPPSANAFLVPVLLVADCRDMKPALLRVQTIHWWNPETQRWQEVPGVVVSLLGKSVTAPLWHFSKYKVGGKAGW